MPQRDISGERFGRLTVIGLAGSDAQGRIYECRCDCGQFTQVAATYLRSGHTKSCGCLSRDIARERGAARRKWTFPNPVCNVEGCPRQGQNMWLMLPPREMAVKGTDGKQTVTIYHFHCAVQNPAGSRHSGYFGPHGEPAKHIATGQCIFTDSTTGQLIETESSHARVMGSSAFGDKQSKAQKRAWKKHRETRLQAIRISNANPIRRAKIRAAGERRWANNPEERKKYSAKQRARWDALTPRQRKRKARHQTRGFRTPEAMQRKSESLKHAWAERKAKLAALLKAAKESLPSDSKERPRTWRIAGMLLLEKDRVSNREVGSAMDELGVRCPYGRRNANGTKETTTWSAYFAERRGWVWMNEIRNWADRPGA